jgi:peptidyl-prolyl cis-trans isomerase B (cyclophilin B)
MGTDKRARQKAGRAARLEQAAQTQQRSQRKRTVTGLAIVVVIVAAIGVFFVARGNKKSSGVSCPKADGSSPRTLTFSSPPPQCMVSGKTYTATVKTNLGTVVMKMDPSKAPKAANAFVFLSGYHYYDNTKFFRVAQSLDITQGGSPHTQSNADTGPGFELTDEPTFTTDSAGQMKGPYTYNAGDLALANSGQPNSADGQFFFVTGPNGKNMNAQGTYMIIAHVTSGLPTLQKIVSTAKADPTSTTGDQVPNPPATVQSITITSK